MDIVLDSLPEGIAFADQDGLVRFWNHAAEVITGHAGVDLVGQPIRSVLEKLVVGGAPQWVKATEAETLPGRGSLVRVRHRLGHDLPVLAKVLPLLDTFGGHIGTAAVFHPAENLDALPRGDSGESESIEASQSNMQDRLEMEYEDFLQGDVPFGVLWITVDQAHALRKTHGGRACEAMVEKIERTLMQGLRPTEQMGRWGEDEFLVLSHERTAETLAAHAHVLVGLARTTEFRWWGDRVSLTVSLGAAQADVHETLPDLLERAQAAMLVSIHAGGNHGTLAPGRKACLPS
jgi:diguanylate cyclase (GGDEF)-like protein/PAS domain S-box-containing protein